MDSISELLAQLASDWDYEGEITAGALLFRDLGFQSLDAVVLGNSLQERFGQLIPYADLLADIGQRELNDVTVGEWAEFTYQHLNDQLPGAPL
jgi:acyl carrier protein